MFLGGWLVFWIDRVHRRGERPTLATCRRFRGTVLWMQPKMIPILDLPAFLTLVSPMPHRSGSSPNSTSTFSAAGIGAGITPSRSSGGKQVTAIRPSKGTRP